MMSEITPAVAWFVSAVLIVAAVIDGRQLRVPNWLTYPFALAGLAHAYCFSGQGMDSLLCSLAGLAVGLLTLLPLYAIGGMGAGDVKLMAGVGAWVGTKATLWAFAATAGAGGVIALVMILASGDWVRHLVMFQTIAHEILTIRDPVRLSERAKERKPSMRLLPYGIPIAVGSIASFAWLGLFFR